MTNSPQYKPKPPPFDANNLPPPGQVQRGAVPPHDEYAQDSIISSVFLSEGARAVIDRVVAIGLEPKHFHGKAYQLIWESILRVETDGLEVGVVEVKADLNDLGRLDQVGGSPFLVRFVTLPFELTRVEGHARRIIELWKQREAIAFQQYMVARMYHPEGVKGQALLEEAEAKFYELAHEQRESSYEAASVIAGRAVTALGAAANEGKSILGTTTGFPELDKKTGGYGAGQLIIIAARPGMGKTAAVVSSLLALTKPNEDGSLSDAAYFHSCEMPRDEVALRMVCSISGVEFQKIKLNTLSGHDWRELLAACDVLAKHQLFIDDRPAVSLLEFRANIRKIKRDVAQGRVKAKALVVAAVDYLQLMTGKGASRELEIAGLSRGLKECAKADQVAIIALSQLNRDVEKRGGAKGQQGREAGKRPQLSDLRESGSVEGDADMVIFIYRVGYYDHEDKSDEAEFIVAKQRSGPTCTVYVTFHGPTTTFKPKATGYEEFENYGEDGRKFAGWGRDTHVTTSLPAPSGGSYIDDPDDYDRND